MGGYSKHRAAAPSPDKALLKPFSIWGGLTGCMCVCPPPRGSTHAGATGLVLGDILGGGPPCPKGPSACPPIPLLPQAPGGVMAPGPDLLRFSLA